MSSGREAARVDDFDIETVFRQLVTDFERLGRHDRQRHYRRIAPFPHDSRLPERYIELAFRHGTAPVQQQLVLQIEDRIVAGERRLH